MSNYCRFVGFKNCKFSEPKFFKNKYWISVNYFLCDDDDQNFKMGELEKYVPEGCRIPTKEEFEELVEEYPFFVKQKKDVIKGTFTRTYYGEKRTEDYELPVFTFKNELGLEVSVYNYDDNWSGFKYGPICFTKDSYDEYMKYYNKPDQIITKEDGTKYYAEYNPVNHGHCAWYGNQCYDIACKKYYEHFDSRVPRCLMLIKDPNKYELIS